MHHATVEDADEDGEGIRTPAVPEKKVIIKDAKKVNNASPEHIAKMLEAAKKAREAKKAAQGDKKEMAIKEPNVPSKSERKSVHFCNCPSCPDKH
jgi:hypothetical protein